MFGGWDSLLGLMTTTAVAGPSEGVSRLLRTKASPAASTVFDIIDGETFDGTPVDIMSLEGLGSAIITESLNKLPFTAQDTLEALGNGEMPTGAAFNFFGVKSAPVTLTEQRDMIAQETFDAHWSDLTGKEQDTIKASHAELFRDLDEDTKERAANGDVEAQARLERKKVDDDRIAEEAALGAAVQSGRLSVNDFTDRMNVLQASSADQKQRIDSLLGLSYGESDNPNVRALGEWYDLRDTAMIEGTNILDFELWEEIEASYMAGLTPEQTRFIEDRSRPEHAPEVDWYYQSKDIVSGSGYYDTIDAAFDMLSPALSNIKPPVANYSDLLRRIQTAKQSGDIANLNQLEAIKDAMGRTAGAQKRLLRVGNPALDQALLQLGRVSTPITSQR
jgi:hypothetical protein